MALGKSFWPMPVARAPRVPVLLRWCVTPTRFCSGMPAREPPRCRHLGAMAVMVAGQTANVCPNCDMMSFAACGLFMGFGRGAILGFGLGLSRRERLGKVTQGLQGGLERAVFDGHCHANVACGGAAKAFAGHHGDVVFVQKGIGKGVAVQPGAADVQHQVHRALCRNRGNCGLARQHVLSQGASATKGGCNLCFYARALIQGICAGILDKPRHAICRMGGKIDHVVNGIGGANHPAAARAGHGVTFRHGSNDQGPLCHLGQAARAQMCALPDLTVIDLVRDQPQVMALAHLCNAFKRGSGINDARGVVGRIDQQACSTCCGGVNVAFAGLKRIIRPRLDCMGDRADAAQGAGIGGIIGINVERFVARVAYGGMAGKQGGLPPGRDQDIVAGRLDTGAFGCAPCNTVAQGVGARHHGIARVPTNCAFMHLLQDRSGSADVMFAYGQLNDRNTLRDHVTCPQKHIPST